MLNFKTKHKCEKEMMEYLNEGEVGRQRGELLSRKPV